MSSPTIRSVPRYSRQSVSGNKALEERRKQWDEIAPIRFREIHLGTDLNHKEVLAPAILEQFEKYGVGKRCLDLGCGFGDIAKQMALSGAKYIRAVDFSARSIELANRYYSDERISYKCDLTTNQYKEKYQFIVASMFLMDTDDLASELKGISRCLEDKGVLVATVPHPCFWPIRRQYVEDAQFDYFTEASWKGPYSLSNEKLMGFQTTHYTRPLSLYISRLVENGLNIVEIKEMTDHSGADRLPRFARFTCVRGQLN